MGTVVASSTAETDSVEHIFFRLGANQGGNYTLRIEHAGGGNSEAQEFALAWWIGDTAPPVPGDFDDDGKVDGDDLGEWRNDFGQTAGSDADGDGDSDGADFLVWQQNLGMTSATPTAAAIPEPAAAMLCTLAASLLWMSRRSR